jgi:hypothetical protein
MPFGAWLDPSDAVTQRSYNPSYSPNDANIEAHSRQLHAISTKMKKSADESPPTTGVGTIAGESSVTVDTVKEKVKDVETDDEMTPLPPVKTEGRPTEQAPEGSMSKGRTALIMTALCVGFCSHLSSS